MNPFPFTIHWGGHYTLLPTFHAVRDTKQTWFEFDVLVRSPKDVTFKVYDMKDFCHGGRGGFIYEVEAVVAPRLLKARIESRILVLAQDEEIRIEHKRRTDAIAAINKDYLRTYRAKFREDLK